MSRAKARDLAALEGKGVVVEVEGPKVRPYSVRVAGKLKRGQRAEDWVVECGEGRSAAVATVQARAVAKIEGTRIIVKR